ncbi:MAG: hypothetical protein GWM90_06950, partial [Gemmatimonadetes bacterium]|nr:polymer-forming cytoskeletal protein [Gemmatimonadota bacterium]NIQ53536.1 polymer-forming cytoskeletal protein [Gemmatimonadota bacterium]NIU73684.1 hypothetical protein [Gammaproteobacteria bacterium]NIX43854.1 hypothetical protein [Gemmatimonadota bacterium]NIY08056.1 hypothetical protein [Gemmatimonadota bacterium]
RFDGAVSLPAGDVLRGDVAAVGGPFRIAGRVEGDVAMLDGDVVLEPGGEVTGSVIVVGGEVRLADDARVGGTITAYGEQWSRWGEDERDRDRDDWPLSRWSDRGHSELTVRIGASYNRVEGLPIMFGPVVQTAGSNPLRLEALAIWRSESGALDSDRMGYRARAEQFLGGHRRLSVGASVYSVVDPMDRWRISDLEASLAAALFHDDYRDHYDRTGWSAFATVEPVRGVEARLEYRDEEHEALPAGDPWSLFDGGDAWRLQPMIARGTLRSLVGSLEIDRRDDDDDPYRGWLARLALERPVGGTLTRPELLLVEPTGEDPVPDFFGATEVDTDFTTGLLDVRRYMPVGYRSQLNVRVVAGGRLDDGPLPAQMQHALGGIGTLPGFATFHADCGARRAIGEYGEDRFYAGYGCDRFALGQVEYRGSLALDFGFGDPERDEDDWDDDWWHHVHLDIEPAWVVFFDAGRGWAAADRFLGPERDTG